MSGLRCTISASSPKSWFLCKTTFEDEDSDASVIEINDNEVRSPSPRKVPQESFACSWCMMKDYEIFLATFDDDSTTFTENHWSYCKWKTYPHGKFHSNANKHFKQHCKGTTVEAFISNLADKILEAYGKRGWTHFVSTRVTSLRCMRKSPLSSDYSSDYSSEYQESDNAIADFLATSNVSFASVETPQFRKFRKDLKMTRRGARKAVFRRAKQQTLKYLNRCRGKMATLAIDVGTVWHRFVGVTLHTKDLPPIIIRLAKDDAIAADVTRGWERPMAFGDADAPESDDNALEEDDDEEEGYDYEEETLTVMTEATKTRTELSGDLCAQFVELMAHQLYQHMGILVTSVVTDNGTNMISMARRSQGPKGQLFSVRCACHVIQLIVQACVSSTAPEFSELGKGWKAFEDFYRWRSVSTLPAFQKLKLKALITARWNCYYESLDNFLCKPNSRDLWSAYMLESNERVRYDCLVTTRDSLAEWMVATKVCDSSSSDLLDTFAAFSATSIVCLLDTPEVLKQVNKLATMTNVLVAAFLPVWTLTDFRDRFSDQTPEGRMRIHEKLRDLMDEIAEWLRTDMVKAICVYLGISHTGVMDQAKVWRNKRQVVAAMTTDLVRRFFEVQKKEGAYPDLFTFIEYLCTLTPSESEVERLLRRTKLAVPTFRKSLNPLSVEAIVRVGLLSCVDEIMKTSQPSPKVNRALDKNFILAILNRAVQIREGSRVAKSSGHLTSTCKECRVPIQPEDEIQCGACGYSWHIYSCQSDVECAFFGWKCRGCEEKGTELASINPRGWEPDGANS